MRGGARSGVKSGVERSMVECQTCEFDATNIYGWRSIISERYVRQCTDTKLRMEQGADSGGTDGRRADTKGSGRMSSWRTPSRSLLFRGTEQQCDGLELK